MGVRNQLCPCGSGKKAKLCCDGRKPISQTVTVDFGEPGVINGLRIGLGGRIEMLRDGEVIVPRRAWVGTHRERPKGDKHLVQIPIAPANLQMGQTPALMQFDRIFAIDTNTGQIGDALVSVSCFAQCRLKAGSEDETFEYGIQGAFDFQNGPTPKCENFAWHLLMQMIIASPDHDSQKRYAIITDSDLGRHGAYNERSEPYFATHLLPANFTLLYATDKGRDFTNQAIKLCDQKAREMWRRMEAGEIGLAGGLQVPNGWCSQFRVWANGNGDFATAGWPRLGPVPINALMPPQGGNAPQIQS